MSGALSRLSKLAAHFISPSASPTVADAPNDVSNYKYNIHTLSPTFFLPRAAAIEPDVGVYRRSVKFQLTPDTGALHLP